MQYPAGISAMTIWGICGESGDVADLNLFVAERHAIGQALHGGGEFAGSGCVERFLRGESSGEIEVHEGFFIVENAFPQRPAIGGESELIVSCHEENDVWPSRYIF